MLLSCSGFIVLSCLLCNLTVFISLLLPELFLSYALSHLVLSCLCNYSSWPLNACAMWTSVHVGISLFTTLVTPMTFGQYDLDMVQATLLHFPSNLHIFGFHMSRFGSPILSLPSNCLLGFGMFSSQFISVSSAFFWHLHCSTLSTS